MIVVCISTISYLYYTNNLSSSDYFKLIMSDAYYNNFYNNLVEFVSNNLNPIKFIEFNNNEYKSFSTIKVEDPIIYIYNSNQTLSYKIEYNNKTTVYTSAYYLSNELNNIGINNIFEDTIIDKYENNIDIILSDRISSYESIKYILDIGRSNYKNSNIKINNMEYGVISLYTNKKNIQFIKNLHYALNNNCKGISKIYFSNSYDDNIRIDIGGYDSSFSEVLRSIKVLSISILEVING